ncbi:MAG: hypothetical protein M0042_12520 [Nitrospiraceae bacterium]|nr:hypothetical protein [Nitrospiraceae bacterium]
MIKQVIIVFAAVVLIIFISGSLLAGELKEIELTDGSVISGEVQSLSNGIYTIKTPALGTVKVEDSRVRVIRPKGSSSPAPQPNANLEPLQQKMLSDQEIMGKIESLKNDPEFQKIMSDPEIMQALSSGDMATLMANPKFLNLLSNPTVQDIQKKVSK